jgi:molybdate transport system substrate-binding protein
MNKMSSDFGGSECGSLSTFPLSNFSRSLSSILCLLLLPFCLTPLAAAELLVAAASDLATAEKTLTQEFEAVTGHHVQFVFHASGMLARQIQHGAPYDAYLSANEKYVRDLVAAGDLLEDSVVVYATGRLGLWSARWKAEGLEDLLREDVRHIAIANPAHAPYGLAAKQVLVGRNLWERLQPRIVLGENVRQAWQYGDSGNADVVITSWTLVLGEGGVIIPAEWHEPIRQAGGVLKQSKQLEAARSFLEFLMSARGQSALRRHGLFPPEE